MRLDLETAKVALDQYSFTLITGEYLGGKRKLEGCALTLLALVKLGDKDKVRDLIVQGCHVPIDTTGFYSAYGYWAEALDEPPEYLEALEHGFESPTEGIYYTREADSDDRTNGFLDGKAIREGLFNVAV